MTDQAEPLDTGQIKPDDLYQQACDAFTYQEKRGLSWRSGVRAAVDVAIAHRCPDPAERQPFDVLREAATILDSSCLVHAGGWCPSADGSRRVADRLEVEHFVAQEKAAADAAREKLIDEAARTMAAKHNPNTAWEDMSEYTQGSFIEGARALADADLLAADPETTDGGAA